MPTQEERLTALEQTTAEYRPVLQNIAYELTMVKGLTIDQVRITQQLRQDMSDVKERLSRIEELRQDMSDVKERLSRIEEQLGTILTLLRPS
jgi:chromosome segregation ATPase